MKNRFKVTTEEIRPDTEEEPGCYVVRVGDRVLGFERNQVNADFRARVLKEIIAEAMSAGFDTAKRNVGTCEQVPMKGNGR